VTDDPHHERARTISGAWRSGGAHDLARKLVLVARSKGASDALQARIAGIVLATEDQATAVDVAHALRREAP
jgi:hypothetical protein